MGFLRRLFGARSQLNHVTFPAAVSVCPYCGRSAERFTQDHIFPAFLGGRCTTPACVDCNSRFGYSFEAIASETVFHPFQVWLCAAGVRLVGNGIRWRRACQRDGEWYDAIVEAGRVKLSRSTPLIVKDDQGSVLRAEFPSLVQAVRFKKGMSAKHKRDVRVEKQVMPVDRQDYTVEFAISEPVLKVAIKMCIALATGLHQFDYAHVRHGAEDLQAEGLPTSTAVDFQNHLALDRLRTPLSHVIYVERNDRVTYGLVQFFGTWQVHCLLSQDGGAPSGSLLATYDPLSGSETFEVMRPLDLPDALGIDPARHDEFNSYRALKLVDQIEARTGTRIDPTLHAVPFEWEDTSE